MTTKQDPPWIKCERAAELLSVSVATIYRRVKTGKLIASGTGTGMRIWRDSVLRPGSEGRDA